MGISQRHNAHQIVQPQKIKEDISLWVSLSVFLPIMTLYKRNLAWICCNIANYLFGIDIAHRIFIDTGHGCWLLAVLRTRHSKRHVMSDCNDRTSRDVYQKHFRSSHFKSQGNYCCCISLILIIQSIFVHVMAAGRSWHVHNCDLIG